MGDAFAVAADPASVATAAPAPAEAETDLTPIPDRIEVLSEDPGIAPAGAPAAESEKPDGALDPQALKAVQAERARAQRYRQIAEQFVQFDEQGNVAGFREPEVAPRPAPVSAAPAGVSDEQYRARLEQVADSLGLLPEQVEGVYQIVSAVVEQSIAEANAPLYRSNAERVKAQIIESPDIPAEAAPFVEKWVNEAIKVDPKTLTSPEAMEIVKNQAVGEYYRRRAVAERGGNAGVQRTRMNPPTLLGNRPGAARSGPTPDEIAVRRRFGLPDNYVENPTL